MERRRLKSPVGHALAGRAARPAKVAAAQSDRSAKARARTILATELGIFVHDGSKASEPGASAEPLQSVS
jgi:hypothetical protein